MTAYDWEDAIGRDPEAIGIAAARSPLDYPWGYYSGPRSAGTSIHVFQWFASPHEMLTWLQEAEPVRFFEDRAEVAEVAAAISAASAGVAFTEATLSPGVMTAAAEPLSSRLEMLWWGTFDELCDAFSGFAAALREEFRESAEIRSEADPATPITSAEMPEFVEFLRTYGV